MKLNLIRSDGDLYLSVLLLAIESLWFSRSKLIQENSHYCMQVSKYKFLYVYLEGDNKKTIFQAFLG